jgi:hypothetical protein
VAKENELLLGLWRSIEELLQLLVDRRGVLLRLPEQLKRADETILRLAMDFPLNERLELANSVVTPDVGTAKYRDMTVALQQLRERHLLQAARCRLRDLIVAHKYGRMDIGATGGILNSALRQIAIRSAVTKQHIAGLYIGSAQQHRFHFVGIRHSRTSLSRC